MKKLFALALALAMLFSVAASAEEASTAEPLEFLTIDLGDWDITTYGGDAISDYLTDKFQFTFNIHNEDWSSYEEQIALWGAADELPDMFCGYIDETWFGDFISEGLIRTIPLEMLQKYPHLYNYWLNDATCQAMYNYYGVIYYVPRTDTNEGLFKGSYTGGAAIYYRKDWAKKLGIAEPTNCDELLAMLTAFAKDDPDGDGIDDTYGLTTTFRRMESLWSWFNCYPSYWIKTADGYMPGYLDRDNMLDALNWLRTAYQSGAIDPEWQGVNTGFANGTFGAYCYHSNPGWANNVINDTFGTANPDLGNPMDIVGYLCALPEHKDTQPTCRQYFCDGLGVFSYDCSDAIVDRMLMFIDWMYEGEGSVIMGYGFEGEDYTVGEDGRYNRITDNLGTKYPSICLGGLVTWGAGSEFDITRCNYTNLYEGVAQQDMIDLGVDMLDKINAASENPAVTFSLMASLISTEEKSGFMFDWESGLLNIISGTDDVTAMYDAFVKDAYDYGVQDVIDSVEAALAK